VVGMTWFGGRYKDSSHFFANWAVDTDQFFEVYPDVRVSVEQKRAFLETQPARSPDTPSANASAGSRGTAYS